MTTGYGLKKVLYISLRKSEILASVVRKFLENNGIEHQNTRINSNGVPEEIKIVRNEDIINFYDIGSGIFINIAEKIEYLNQLIREYKGQNIATDNELFLRIYAPWTKMHSHWKNKKYTLDYFKEEFDINSVENPITCPNPEYPSTISTKYVAGAFDGSGNVSLVMSEDPANNTGYGMNISARVTISHPDIRVKPNLINYFQDNDLDPSITENQERIEIRFDTIDDVETFIEYVGQHTTYLYPLCDLFFTQLIPAYKDQYHTTKEGFLDMIRAYEEVAPERKRAKYTTEFFEEKWDV